MGKHAILLSGGLNKKYNSRRYRNDLEFAYKILIEDCGYDAENIQIFFADGKDLKYGSVGIQTMAAEKEKIVSALQKMTEELSAEDSLTLIVSNHGGNAGLGCIYLWGNEFLELELLVQILNKISAPKNIILEECYGGNILDMNVENACIVTANERGLVSYGCLNSKQYEYDEFLLHFLSFIHGKYPDGKDIKAGENDIIKAHEYALKNDIFSPYNPQKYNGGCVETPQIKCNLRGKVRL